MRPNVLRIILCAVTILVALGCERKSAPEVYRVSMGPPGLNFAAPDSLVRSIWARDAWVDSIEHAANLATDYYTSRAESLVENHRHLMRLMDSALGRPQTQRDTIWRSEVLASGRLRLSTRETRGDRVYYLVMRGGQWRVDDIYTLCPLCKGRGKYQHRVCGMCGGVGATNDLVYAACTLPEL
jgi:hypothetical protein